MADIGPAVGRVGTCQQIAYTGSSVAITNPFGAQTAATTDPFLAALWVETVKVQPGQRISAIRASTDGLVTATSGTLSVTELTN